MFLMESLFLSMFLPSLSSPLSLAVVAPPSALVAFSFRFLTFRLMFGFGKFKFIGASTREFSYLHGFTINQPIPTGQRAHHAAERGMLAENGLC
jgi:hypothetical protein